MYLRMRCSAPAKKTSAGEEVGSSIVVGTDQCTAQIMRRKSFALQRLRFWSAAAAKFLKRRIHIDQLAGVGELVSAVLTLHKKTHRKSSLNAEAAARMMTQTTHGPTGDQTYKSQAHQRRTRGAQRSSKRTHRMGRSRFQSVGHRRASRIAVHRLMSKPKTDPLCLPDRSSP